MAVVVAVAAAAVHKAVAALRGAVDLLAVAADEGRAKVMQEDGQVPRAIFPAVVVATRQRAAARSRLPG